MFKVNPIPTAKVGENFVKKYEKNTEAQSTVEAQQRILKDANVINYSLGGVTLKTRLYALFSLIAALELGAACFFYLSTFNLPFYGALATAIAFGAVFHHLCHNALVTAAKGLVFELNSHSNAAKVDVAMNIAIAIILCVCASLTVYFIGKPSYITYRNNCYKSPSDVNTPVFTASQMTSSNGKLSVSRANAVIKLTDNNQKYAAKDRLKYDVDTYKSADIVGTSAFFIEFILIILAYGIETAKRAATIEITAHHQNQNVDTKNQNAFEPGVNQQNFKTNPIGFVNNAMRNAMRNDIKKVELYHCLQCNTEFERRTTWQKYCCENCRILKHESRTGKKIRR